ncbi:MAG TPA: response regulator [Stellaceae bacterium]
MLVVDDQADVREVAVAHLEALGYQVAQAASGRTALDLIGDGSGIDLLIADYAMPGMSGVELARAVRAKRPDLPVVIVTGYVDVSAFATEIEGADLLKKPYRVSELAATVELALRRDDRGETQAKVVALRGGHD